MKEEESDHIIDSSFGLSAVYSGGTRAIDREFINKYRTLTALWDSKHKDYTNKYKRNAALDLLVPIMKKWHKSATRYHVRSKINVLRSYYRKDLRMFLASKTIGPDGKVSYEHVPKNWKFEALRFLDTNNELGDIDELQDIAHVDVGDTSIDTVNYEETHSNEASSENEEPLYEETYEPTHKQPLKRRKELHSTYQYKQRQQSMLKQEHEEFLSTSGDLSREYEAIAANVVCKLQRMNPQQQCLAELLINKVLIGGLKEQLTDDTDLSEVYKP